MNKIRRVITLFIIIMVYPYAMLYGQAETTEVDSTFEQQMSEAWEDVRESEFSDSLQNYYSERFFDYYMEHQDSETGKSALGQAFLMWGNTGNPEHVRQALQTLDYDSELWARIINSLGNIYHKNEELGAESYSELLEYLSARLTYPSSKSQVLLVQLRRGVSEDNPDEEAIDIARQLVELDANEFFVEQGLGYLHEFESLNIGQPAPDFEAVTTDGRAITTADLEGQVTLLEFWATWCGPCLPEIPHLKELHDRYGEEDFEIVGISLDRDQETLLEFVEQRNMEWPQIFEEEGWSGEIPRLYNVSGIPRMYILDREGNIAARDLRGEEMVAAVDSLMNGN